VIGLDTNILVRFLAQDDVVQSPRSTQIIERQLTEERPRFISLVTIVETVWVLDRILQADSLFVQNEQEVFTAAIALKTGVAAFADALIGALGAWAGCTATLTFDKRAARLKQFQLA
jgi:predicted nucleic-acid-binding protein